MPIWSKKRQFYQPALYYGSKKSIGCPLYPIFHGKITSLMPIFCQENVHSRKNTLLSYPYFVEKTSNLSKTRCSHVNFCSNFTWKTSCSSPYLVIKRQLCQNYTLLWAQKVNNMLFFFAISHKKYPLSWPYFVKNVHSLKNTRCSHARILQKNHTALMLIFCQKNVYSLKSTMLSCYFFQIFMENPLLSHALIRSKNVNSVKTTLYGLWAKEVNRMPFFSHFS